MGVSLGTNVSVLKGMSVAGIDSKTCGDTSSGVEHVTSKEQIVPEKTINAPKVKIVRPCHISVFAAFNVSTFSGFEPGQKMSG